MDKKGDWTADTAPFMAIFIIVCSGLFMVFLFIVSGIASDIYQIRPGTSETILEQRFWDDCFVKYDLLSGAEIADIDWEKFNQKNLDTCYDVMPNSEYFGYSLTLRLDDEEKQLQTKNWKGKANKGETNKVLVWKGSKKIGELLIEVQK